MKIGCMLWRIGDILDLYNQIQWVKSNDFEEVSFWTIAGNPGVWQGFDAEGASEESIAKLKKALAGIPEVDLHAGIPLDSRDEKTRKATLEKLDATFRLAKNIGASVVTIHPDPITKDFSGAKRIEAMKKSLMELDAKAAYYRVLVGIETAGREMGEDMSLVEIFNLPRVGITLDTGHVQSQSLETLSSYGSWGRMIEKHHRKIFHLHMHDYNNQFDHIAIGKGYIDFDNIIRALCKIRFTRSLCLEINPDRETPEGIIESRDKLIAMINEYK